MISMTNLDILKFKAKYTDKSSSNGLNIMDSLCCYCECCDTEFYWIYPDSYYFPLTKEGREEAQKYEKMARDAHNKILENKICPLCGGVFDYKKWNNRDDVEGYEDFDENTCSTDSGVIRECLWDNKCKDGTCNVARYDESVVKGRLEMAFKRMRKKRELVYDHDDKKNTETKTPEVISEIERMKNYAEDVLSNVSEIRESSKQLTAYIKKCVEIEQAVYSIKKRIERLIYMSYGAKREEDRLINAIQKKYKEEEKAINNSRLDNKFLFELMPAPIRPVFEKKEPAKPVLLKPGLFNRKKIEIQNKEIEERYEKDMREYRKCLEEFEKDMEQYNISSSETIRVNKELSDKNDKIKSDFEMEKIRKKSELNEKLRLELEQINDNNGQQKPISGYKVLQDELETAKVVLARILGYRDKLYSYDVVFSKYRTLSALSTMYEYFATGRVSKLEGSDGAYNLYESELRANIIIDKLDTVIDKLDEIKQNQYTLCDIMRNVQDQLGEIDNKLLKANESIADIRKNVYDIKNISQRIEENTYVTAYYAEKTAYYQKMTAFLTFIG